MYKSFGEKLLTERRKRGLTALLIARACGVSRSYITLIETGRRLPGKKNIRKIAKALKVNTDVVLNWYLEEISQKIKKGL